MQNYTRFLKHTLGFWFTFFLFQVASSQTTGPKIFSIKEFGIWGGSGNPGVLNAGQGVFIRNGAKITGSIGSNQHIDIGGKSWFIGNVVSGNTIAIKNNPHITGNIFANNIAGTPTKTVFSSTASGNYRGNITANGKVNLKFDSWLTTVSMTGQVAVPAPSATNYIGPAPANGFTNSFQLPVLPVMPNNTPYDHLGGTTDINATQTLSPGSYRKIQLAGGQTLTLNGPGNYIFTEVVNTAKNNLVVDMKKLKGGVINIFIIGNARWGNISVRAINTSSTSLVYTEVHGNGSTNNGNAFEILADPTFAKGTSAWIGNVWAPFGSIRVVGLKTSAMPTIAGALWSAVSVKMEDNVTLNYKSTATTNLTFIDPYYAPPPTGKVNETNNIIGAELTALSQNPDPITSKPENEIFKFDGEGNVMIEVISKNPNDNVLKQQLADLGMTNTIDNGPHSYVITGNFPINRLSELNSNPLIEYVRPLYPPVTNRGQVTTQGDKTMRSDILRERFGLDGSGVKIGVLSDSYNNKSSAQDDVDQGDLPGLKSSGDANENGNPVQIVQELQQGGKDEGRAMLQIVHDIAPKAKLAFRTGFLSAGDFAKGILELADPNLEGGKCDIIVDDLSYITEPFFRDGVVAQVVDQVVAEGVTYFTSAGNFGKRSYEATFKGVTNTAAIPAPAQVHQFGTKTTDIYQSILLKSGTYTIVLQWDDEFHSLGDDGVRTDLDLYLVGSDGFRLFGFNRSNLFKDPFEVCPFTVKDETTARVMVVRAAGTRNVRFKYIIFRGDATILDYPIGTSTIVGHANSKGAISVGAMFYQNVPGVTTVWPGVASFSSRGGTFTLENNAFTTRNKPDIIAPNGVNTTVNLGGSAFNDGDGYPNFFGTSAAAPHAAGVGALLIQARKKFNLQTTVTPAEIRQQLISRAGKFSNLTGNFTFEGGYGYLQADSSLTSMANAIPIVDTMMALVPGSENGTDSFAVKIVGKYLTPSTQIYKNGVPLPKIIANSPLEAIAMAPPIAPGEDPAFQLFNGAKSLSGLDGGLSEPYYFFSARKTVTIKAENKNKKYSQANPAFTADIRIDGIPIELTGTTLADLKLDPANLSLNTIATATSKAGLYGIFPDLITPLAPDDPLLSQYRFIFTSGTLNVGKLPLKITPDDQTIKYGEYPDEITYSYETNFDGYWDFAPDEYLPEIKRLHEEYMAKNGIIVVKGLNIEDGITLDEDDLENMSTLASFQSVLNAKKYVLENGQLRAMVNTITPNDIGNQRFLIETRANALLNYLNSPNSTTLGDETGSDLTPTGLLNLKALAKGEASGALPNGQLQAMVNGQLMGMVNGELETTLDPEKYAIINGNFTNVEDIVFQNGQLRALVNGEWKAATNGQYRATVNGSYAEFNMFVENGELKAVTNGAYMNMVNGQLRALVNGQNVSIANGQLRAMVNGQLIPLVNNELMGIANGQLRAMVNGEMAALVNGQLMALIDGAYEEVTELNLVNGQLRAMINGQLRALINGQLRAMVNGEISDIDISQVSLVNGQLRAMVNGQLRAMVNGQLRAIVNGQLRAMVNSEAIAIEKMIQLPNGQLKALVNGNYIPIRNGQLRAMVNGQLRAMVNGELMAALINGQLTALIDGESVEITELILENGQLKAMINGQLRALINGQLRAMVNGELTDIDVNEVSLVNGQLRAMVNGQLRAMVNGQLRAIVNGELMPKEDNQINFTVFENGQLKAMVNGQLRAMVNGQLRAMVNGQMEPVDSYVIENGQLKAIVNGEDWIFPNGQLKALVNGQLKALVNNFDVSGTNNNANTMVLVGEDDLLKQQGDIGGMFSMAMITGIDAGNHRIIPAAFINENYEVSYEVGYLDILKSPVTVTTGNATKVYGEQNPDFTDWSITPLAYNETFQADDSFEGPDCDADETSNVGLYPIEFYPTLSDNYYMLNDFGNLTITPKLLTVRADNKQVTIASEYEIPAPTITYDGLVGDDTEDSVCVNFVRPSSPKVINDWDRTATFSNVLINGQSNVFYATPGQNLNLSGTFVSYRNPIMDCPGCITQFHIGMGDGVGNFFSNCYEATNDGSTGNLNTDFNAPSTAGVYYITTMGSWWYNCGQFQDPNHKVANPEKLAIAVVIVNATGTIDSGDKISASVDEDQIYSTGPGDYPITLAGCGSYNPNYNVVLENGTLSILPENDENACNNLYTIHWKGNGNYKNNNEDLGTPVGGVTFSNESKEGSSSFSFDGTGHIDVGTAGSVSGQGDFSVSAWVKTTSLNPMVIINQREAANINGEYMLKIGGPHYSVSYKEAFAGRASFLIYDVNNNFEEVDLLSNTLVNDGAWHHIRGERKGTTINLYVDGVLEATANTAGVVNLNSTIRTFIGYDQLAQQVLEQGSYFEGLIDDIKVEICLTDPGIAGVEILTEEAVVAPKAKKEIITKDLVYPNPASNTIRLQLTEDVVNINEIQVLSAMGKVNKTSARKIDDGVYELNISGLTKGLYFIRSRTPGGIKTLKFVKM